MTETHVSELTTEAEWRRAYPVMYELRPIDESDYLAYLDAMASEGYHLFGLFEESDSELSDSGESALGESDSEDSELLALAGVRISTTLYHGLHAWVYDLVTRSDRRSEGHGEALLSFVEEWAADRDCAVVELASGLWREDAHRFYEDHVGYERYCYTFKKDLGGTPGST